MIKTSRLLAAAALIALIAAGCGKEKKNESTEPEAFAFTIYPGSRYLAQVTDLWKQARKVMLPGSDVPPIAIYDTDAPIDKVAEFYAQSYGYNKVAPDATNNLSSAKPPAYYRTGELATDVAGIVPVAQKMNLKLDPTKAVGSYRAAEIDPTANRPRVTIQRPYFDVSTSQTVDRTLIMMSR
ncbi:MAG: hypothetical protein QOC81_2416 [Thermoanaerobaculia bacterium]|jgi:hypothetical protein|nr:hypothetical protein [Thermoanaerobaculia bacterium]